MSESSNTIIDKIKKLEGEHAKLLSMRKNEIFEVIKENGGVGIDNKLLAGFIIYALLPENKGDEFVLKMKEVGEKARFPRSGAKRREK